MVKNPPASSGHIRDTGSIPGSGRSPRGGNGYPLQCSCLDNPMDRGAWRATVHGVVKSRTRLKRLSTKTCTGKLNRFTKVPKVNHTSCKTQIHFTLTEKLNYLLNSYLTKDSLTTEEKKTQSFPKKPFDANQFTSTGQKYIFLKRYASILQRTNLQQLIQPQNS